MIEVELLTQEREEAYEKFLQKSPEALIYASLKFKSFLSLLITSATPKYLVAIERKEIVGVLPAFVARSVRFGAVINALPFFGSHGAVVAANSAGNEQIRRKLISALLSLEKNEGSRSTVIVTSPLDSNDDAYRTCFEPNYEDPRIGQFTLFNPVDESQDPLNLLMKSFHQKTRNAVRKAEKQGFDLSRSSAWDDFVWLQGVHQENMRQVGAAHKPLRVFEAIVKSFQAHEDYVLYIARRGAERVAGLLVLYFNRRAEYYVPAIVQEHRNDQPLSFVIFHAMQDAIERQILEWNWGGTSVGNANLYRFKSRWGSVDRPYKYCVRLKDPSLAREDREFLAREFPFFYLFPFNQVGPGR